MNIRFSTDLHKNFWQNCKQIRFWPNIDETIFKISKEKQLDSIYQLLTHFYHTNIFWGHFFPGWSYSFFYPELKTFLQKNFSFKIWSQFLWTWLFVTNYYFLISISLQSNAVDLRYYILWFLLDERIKVWNIKGLHHEVEKT